MNQTYWFEGLFGQTRGRISVTRKGDTWIAEAFAVSLSGEVMPVLNANGNVRSFRIDAPLELPPACSKSSQPGLDAAAIIRVRYRMSWSSYSPVLC